MKLHHSLSRMLVIASFVVASFSASAEGFGSTLDKISKRGVVFLGYREASIPFSYLPTINSLPEGFSVEICRHVIKAIEETLNQKLLTQPVVVSASSRIMMVKTGMADLECGVTTNTVSRSQQVAFSTNFFVSEVKAMVPVELAGRSLKDLANKRFVTVSGTTADRLIKQASIARNVSIRSMVRRNNERAMEALAGGEADVFVADDSVLLNQRAQSENPDKYVILDESFSAEPYAIILPKDDPQFKQLVDDVIIGLIRSGQMQAIYNAWFMEQIPPNNRNLNYPMSSVNKAAYANPNDKPVN